MRRVSFATRLVGFVLLAISSPLALAQQTTAPGTAPGTTPAAPSEGGGLMDWWWVILVVLVVVAAIWYFMRRSWPSSGP